jgi:putative transposase
MGERERAMEKRQFGHRARLYATPAQVALMDAQAHAARAMWNQLHDLYVMTPKCQRSLKRLDATLRQARKEIDWYADLPAQAAQAVLKTYTTAWKNCWEGRAERCCCRRRPRRSLCGRGRVAAVPVPDRSGWRW